MRYRIDISFDFDGTEAEAALAAKEVENAVARANGSLHDITMVDDDGEAVDLD